MPRKAKAKETFRDKVVWLHHHLPPGFEWDYRRAMKSTTGLCLELDPSLIDWRDRAKALDISEQDFYNCFIGLIELCGRAELVTAEIAGNFLERLNYNSKRSPSHASTSGT